jgi:ubiquinone/menaquinone biosynthesis C-methylase UbiE
MTEPTATQLAAIDPTNLESARAWDGDEGAYWAANADHFDRSLAGYQEAFEQAAGVETADVVLDVGCGTGETTRRAAIAAPAGFAVGVDLSGAMLAVARERAAAQDVRNLAFEQADAQVHRFPAGRFDVVISRTGTMFFGDPRSAFTNLAAALRPSGRLVMLVWQGPGPNEWLRELAGALSAGRPMSPPAVGVPGPFALADPDQVRQLLESSGFGQVELTAHRAPMWFGADAGDAFRFVTGLMGWMTAGLDAATLARAHDDLRGILADHATPDGVQLGSGTWLVHAVRS